MNATAPTDDLIDSIPLCDPDMSDAEMAVVGRVLASGSLDDGRVTQVFEEAFAADLGRAHAVAVSGGMMATLLALKAYGIGAGDEVLCTPFGWHQVQHAITLAGATPVFVDVDPRQCGMDPKKAAAKITPATKAILAGNVNGCPARWDELRALATEKGLILIEDSTEAIGSTRGGRKVGTFGDCAVFDFSEPGALLAGGGGMVVTDDRDLAHRLRYLRHREIEHRNTVVITRTIPFQAGMSNLNAALGLVQLKRLPEILGRRAQVVGWYEEAMRAEGLVPPAYDAGVEVVNPLVFAVQLGSRFTASSRKLVLLELDEHGIDASDYGQPLHTQQHHIERGCTRAAFPACQRIAERIVALPLHHKVTREQTAFIIGRLKAAVLTFGKGGGQQQQKATWWRDEA